MKKSGVLCRRVLLVEDQAEIARALVRLLTSQGFTVKTCRTCTEALAVPDRFEIGLLDIGLPDGSGVDLARELIAMKRVTRVVFCTGGASASEMAAARALGPVVSKLDAHRDLVALLQR